MMTETMTEIQFPLVAKIMIKGALECRTGLHIGALSERFVIGGIDSPVVKDPLTGEPYIPGSSLKGKLRSLTERALNKKLRPQKGKEEIKMHWCIDPRDVEGCEVCRLFGYVPMGDTQAEENKMPSALYVRDLCLENGNEIAERITSPLKYTEWKTENALDRVTAASNPRHIERVPKGAKFNFELIYNINNRNAKYFGDDMKTLVSSLCLLEDDCLGGHGSRGYGKVALFIEKVTARKAKYYYAGDNEKKEGTEKIIDYREKKKALLPVSEFKKELPELVKELEKEGFLRIGNE